MRRCGAWGKHIILGLGGSATTDAGTGILYALGMRFFSEDGVEVLPDGQNMIRVKKIRRTENFERFKDIKFTLACDVTNPLCGENGAAYVFLRKREPRRTMWSFWMTAYEI